MPKKVASVYFSFSWLNPLFRIGYRRKLQEDDMYKVLPEDASDRLGEELQRWFKFIMSDCTQGFCLVLLIESIYQFSLIVIKAPFFLTVIPLKVKLYKVLTEQSHVLINSNTDSDNGSDFSATPAFISSRVLQHRTRVMNRTRIHICHHYWFILRYCIL